jgi:hypothetical protein
MDQRMLKHLQAGIKPFDGVTLHLDDLVSISHLRCALNVIVGSLKNAHPGVTLQAFEDWHEHDGYVVSSNKVEWDEIDLVLISDQALYESRHGDTYVRRAFYSVDDSFLLRYYVLDKDEDHLYPGIWGEFDLSCNRSLVDDIQAKLPEFPNTIVRVEQAKVFFDKRHAG